jgi:hypothetical protein
MTGSKILDDEWPDLEALLGQVCLLNVVHTAKDGVRGAVFAMLSCAYQRTISANSLKRD